MMSPLFPVLIETIQRDSVISFPFLGGLRLDPPASFTLFGREIYLYGVVIALAFFLAIVYCAHRAPEFGIAPDSFYDMMIWLIPGAILGARLYYVLFQADYYLAHPGEILAIWEGGLAIYGGIIAGILICAVFFRVKKIRFPAMLDLMSFGVLIGQCIGRWGNFFNREAFGAETEIFCRMGLTAPDGSTIFVHPTFLYESVWNLVGLTALILLSRRRRRRYDGQYFLMYLYLWNTEIRVSQALSIALALTGGVLLFLNRKNRRLLRGGDPQPETDTNTETESQA